MIPDMHLSEANTWVGFANTVFQACLSGAAAFFAVRGMVRKMRKEMTDSQSHLARLRRAIEAAVERAEADDVFSLDLTFRNGKTLYTAVIMGRAVPCWMGVQIQGVTTDATGTYYTIITDFGAELPDHRHEGDESVYVRRGVMTDLTTGTVYHKGDTWHIPAGEWHRVSFESNGIYECHIQPPLKSIAVQPLDLDAIASL